MNFDYNDEQKALKDEARRFLSSVAPLSAVRTVLDNPGDGYDPALWSRIGEQGWCGAAVPEQYGGIGMGHVELCALAEELGRALAPVPFASTVYLVAEALLLAGSEAQKAELLPRISAGELIGALAVSEGPGAVSRPATRFENGRLTGTKLPVTDGLAADRMLVLAQSDQGPGLYLCDPSGTVREGVHTVDPTRGAVRIVFDGTPAEPLGAPGQGLELLHRIQSRAAILLAFEQVGGADRCLDMARDYALERFAFGRPIGSYQAIKHKLADVFVANEVARANAYFGAWALSVNAPELPVAAAASRVSATRAYWLAAKENIQTHGGIGFTWEADCQLFYRRAEHLALVLGSARDWKRRLADGLEAQMALEERP